MERMKKDLDQIHWDEKETAMNDVYAILQSYHSNEGDWKKFCIEKEGEGYSRNEIVTVPNKYTLILMSWKPRNGNFIHDHGGSHALVKVLKGSLVEEHYTYNEENKSGNPWRLVSDITLACNDVNKLDSIKTYHRISNPSDVEAVSLHVFSPPLEECTIREKVSGITKVVQVNSACGNPLSDPEPVVSCEDTESSSTSKIHDSNDLKSDCKPISYDKEQSSEHKQTKEIYKANHGSISEVEDFQDSHIIRKPRTHKERVILLSALRIAPLFLSLTALVLGLTALGIYGNTFQGIVKIKDFQPAIEVQQTIRFCFKCALVGDYPDHHGKSNRLLEMLNNLTRHKIDDHNSECCVENDEQFKALVSFLSASLISKQEVNLPSHKLQTTPVSGHKRLLPEQHSKDKKFGEHFPLTLITSLHDPSYEHVRGVDVTTDGFIVKFTGLYYVYSSVHFMLEQVTDKTLYHYLHRISFNNPMQTGVLLRSVHTICQNCIQSQETSFAGGIFHLQSGDKVQVCVSAPGVVGQEREAMYMGLTMLNS